MTNQNTLFDRRRGRVRSKIARVTKDRPRLSVHRSNKHIYVQVIDDANGVTLVAASTVEKDLRGAKGWNAEAAVTVGKLIAERSKAAGIEKVVFDRGGYLYHGRIKALADAAREGGLVF